MTQDQTVDPSAAPPKRPLAKVTKVLAATDLSARSDRALARAVQLADQHGAQLQVVHVVDDEMPSLAQDQLTQLAKEEIGKALNALPNAGRVSADSKIVPGTGHRAILKAADDFGADLLVLGIHRNESRRARVTGTTMERVVRMGPTPVLVAIERTDGAYEKPVVAVDFSIYSRAAIAGACVLAPEKHLDLVHAYQVPYAGFLTSDDTHDQVREEHEREMNAIVNDELGRLLGEMKDGRSAPSFSAIVRSGPVNQVLRAECARLNNDLLVLGTHGRVGVKHAMLGSVAEDFLNQPPCDVLVVKAW